MAGFFFPDLTSQYYAQGFTVVSKSNTVITLSNGTARSVTNSFDIEWSGSLQGLPDNISLNINTVGPGGCFPNPVSVVTPPSGIAVSPLIIAGDTSGKNDPTLILVTGSDFMPSGYDVYALILAVYIDSLSRIALLDYKGSGLARDYTDDNALSVLSGSAAVYTDVNLSAAGLVVNEETSRYVQFVYGFTPVAAGNVASIYPTGTGNPTIAPVQIKASVAGVQVVGNFRMPIGTDPTGNPSITYKTTGGTLLLLVSGTGLDLPIGFGGKQ